MPAFRLAVAPAVLAWATVGLFAVMAFLRLFRPDWVWRLHVYRMRTEGLTQLELHSFPYTISHACRSAA